MSEWLILFYWLYGFLWFVTTGLLIGSVVHDGGNLGLARFAWCVFVSMFWPVVWIAVAFAFLLAAFDTKTYFDRTK